MQIQICVIEIRNNPLAVIRGDPEKITSFLQIKRSEGLNPEVLFSVSDNAKDMVEEYLLWHQFLAEAEKNEYLPLAEKKLEIWKKKARGLWEIFGDNAHLCFFIENSETMILQKSEQDIH